MTPLQCDSVTAAAPSRGRASSRFCVGVSYSISMLYGSGTRLSAAIQLQSTVTFSLSICPSTWASDLGNVTKWTRGGSAAMQGAKRRDATTMIRSTCLMPACLTHSNGRGRLLKVTRARVRAMTKRRGGFAVAPQMHPRQTRTAPVYAAPVRPTGLFSQT